MSKAHNVGMEHLWLFMKSDAQRVYPNVGHAAVNAKTACWMTNQSQDPPSPRGEPKPLR